MGRFDHIRLVRLLLAAFGLAIAFGVAQCPGAFDGLKLCAENRLEICRLLTLAMIRTLVSRHFAPPTEQVVIIFCCCPATLSTREKFPWSAGFPRASVSCRRLSMEGRSNDSEELVMSSLGATVPVWS
jgi:hypothetical protein